MENKFKMVATTFAGLEEVLAKELTELGGEEVTILKRAVSFFGDQKLMYKVNYECRCALRILKPIFEFYSETEEEFYKAIKEFKWWEVLDIKDTFAIDTVAFNSYLEHTQYITLKAKDAIADCFTEKMNRRPFVDVENPKLKVNIHLVDNNCSISFDSSGNPLFKRGYRYFTNEAPINEVLAAGLIKLTGWHGECNFMDPMCGSGTFLIEAAMVAQNIPAGYYRNEWGFMTWKDFDEELWKEVKNEADDKISESEHDIVGSDISRRNINIARENITRAKLHRDIELDVMPIEEQHAVGETGIAIVNPPYGKRMRPEEIDGLYKLIGDTMKKNFRGYKFYIISSDFLALKRIGLKTSLRLNVFNGPLECKFLCFELYEGSKRTPRSPRFDENGELIVEITNNDEDSMEGVLETNDKTADNVVSQELIDTDKEENGDSNVEERKDFRREDRGYESRERKPFDRDSRGGYRSEDRGRGYESRERKPFDRDSRGGYRSEDRGRGYESRERKPFDRDSRGGYSSEDRGRGYESRERKPFDRDSRGGYRNEDRGRGYESRERKPFDGDSRGGYGKSEDRGRGYESRERKPFDRDSRGGYGKSEDRGRGYESRERKPFDRDSRGGYGKREDRGRGYDNKDRRTFDRDNKQNSTEDYKPDFSNGHSKENKCKIYRKRITE